MLQNKPREECNEVSFKVLTKEKVQNCNSVDVASADRNPNKVYLGTTEGDFKEHFYNHRMSFNNEGHSTDRTLFLCLRNNEEIQDNGITEVAQNQICISLLKHFLEMYIASGRKFGNS